MWIRTQEKKALINVSNFTVEKGPSKGHKGLIYGYFSSGASLSANVVVIGKYASYEDAIKEVDNIENAINENPNTVYQIR